MGDIAQRGNKLTKGVKDLVTAPYRGAKKVVQGAKDLITAPSKRIKKFGGGRTNLLEELGRVEAEPSNRNRRAEISRVHGELNRGYAKGGAVTLPKVFTVTETKKGKPHWTREGQQASIKRKFQRKSDAYHKELKAKREDKVEDGRVGKRAGGVMKAGRAITKLVERAGGGEEGKPHSTRAGRIAAGVRKIKRGARAKKAEGGRIGKAIGGTVRKIAKRAAERWKKKKVYPETEDLTHQKGPYVGDVGSERPGIKRREWLKKPGVKSKPDRKYDPYERHGAKKGGKADKKWIQKAVDPKHKGYCTPMTKKTCTPARKALARTFKKKAKTGW